MVMRAKSTARGSKVRGMPRWWFPVLMVMLPFLNPAFGQTLHSETGAQDSLDVVQIQGQAGTGLDADDPAERERILERLWLVHPAIQSGWGWRSDGTRPTHLGNAHEWQLRMSAREKGWQFGLILDKDRGEPWGRGPVPWTGPELKRWYAARRSDRFHALAGSFRIQQGFGLISGRRISWFPSRSNPLRIPGKMAAYDGYAGAASGPVRSGLLLGLESPRAALRAWYSSEHAAARTGSIESEESGGYPAVLDVSSTGSFITDGSLARRQGVRITASGLQAAVAGMGWQSAILVEHLGSSSSISSYSRIPSSLVAVSLSGNWSAGPITAATEHSLLNGRHHSWHSGMRWKHRSGTGLAFHHARTARGLNSPYGSLGRFHAEPFFATTLQGAMNWRRRGGAVWTIRYARKSDQMSDGPFRTHRWAIDWDSSHDVPGSARHRLQFGHDIRLEREVLEPHGRTHRAYARWYHQPGPRWHILAQTQAGKNARAESMLAGITVTRVPRRILVPEWTAFTLIRRRRGRGVVLYALQPAPIAGFPVLSGSSSINSTIHRLRWRLSRGTLGEVLLRMDRNVQSSPAYAVRFSVRLRVDFQRSSKPS